MEQILFAEKIIQAPVADIWPILSDTAELNRRMGLSPMTFTTINGVRHGKQKVLGMTAHWTEAPWEWNTNCWLENERVFSSGFFQKIGGYFTLTALDEKSCKVGIEFRFITRSGFLRPLLTWGIKKVIGDLLTEIGHSTAEKKNFSMAVQLKKNLAEWIRDAAGIERARISPKLVARETGNGWENILKDALTGDLKTRLALRFDAVCPHCRGAKQSASCLTELPEQIFCDTCEITFPSGTQESIEISLKDTELSPDEASADFCSADITHKPTIYFQRFLGKWKESLHLPEGLYLLKKRGETRPLTIVSDANAPHKEMKITDVWSSFSDELIRVHPDLTIVSDTPDSRGFIMLEAIDKFRGSLIASEVMLHPELSKLIPNGVLKSEFPMEVGHRALMFTDVVGSTELYFKIGDAAAFRLVRESFLFVGEIARRHQGVLVKTIGDATMYTFPTMALALKCAIEIQKSNQQNSLKLRASLHYGPCLSVGTKTGVDFFGDAVNICAKFQSEAEAGQIVFDDSLSEYLDPEYEKNSTQNEKLAFVLKGQSGREFILRRLSF